MDTADATAVFECLSSDLRLKIYRLLVKRGPDGMVAGEIASVLGKPPAHLSFHFKALAQAGLLIAEQNGRFLRYRANLPLMADVIAYLTAECCSGHPEQCADLDAGRTPGRRRTHSTQGKLNS